MCVCVLGWLRVQRLSHQESHSAGTADRGSPHCPRHEGKTDLKEPFPRELQEPVRRGRDPRQSPVSRDVKVFVSCRWGWRASSRSTSVWRSIRSARTRSGWPSAAFTALCRSAVPSPAGQSEGKHFLSVEKMERVAASESEEGSDVRSFVLHSLTEPNHCSKPTWPPHALLLAHTLTRCHAVFRRSQLQPKNGLEHQGPLIISAPDWFGKCHSVDLNIGSSPKLQRWLQTRWVSALLSGIVPFYV